MKFLLLAALIAVCSATVYLPGSRQIYFGGEDRAFIHGLSGQQYVFQQQPGRRFLDIVINGINTPAKKIRIDGETCDIVNLEGLTRFDQTYYNRYNLPNTYRFNYLFNILKNYQGYVDQYQYRTLLKDVKKEIENGRICHIIYHLLTCLDEVVNEDLIENYQKTQQIRPIYPTGECYFCGKSFPGYGYQYPWYNYGKTYGNPWTYLTSTPGYGYQYGYPSYTYGKSYGNPWAYLASTPGYGYQYGYPSYTYGKGYGNPWTYLASTPGYGYQYGYPSYTYGKTYPWTYLTTGREPIFSGLKTDLKDYLRGGLYESDKLATYKPEGFYRYGSGLGVYNF